MRASALPFMPGDFLLLGFCSEPLKKPLIKKTSVRRAPFAKEEPAILVFARSSQKLYGGWEVLIFKERGGFKEFLRFGWAVDSILLLVARVAENNWVEMISLDCILECESLFGINIAVKNLRAAHQEWFMRHCVSLHFSRRDSLKMCYQVILFNSGSFLTVTSQVWLLSTSRRGRLLCFC